MRVDSGVYEGAEIRIYYDPMIAKLIADGEDRNAGDRQHARGTRRLLRRAALTHNMPFLAALLAPPALRGGQALDRLHRRGVPGGFQAASLALEEPAPLVAVAAAIGPPRRSASAASAASLPATRRERGRSSSSSSRRPSTRSRYPCAEGGYDVSVGGERQLVRSAWRIGEPLFKGSVDGRPLTVQVERQGTGYKLNHGGHQLDVRVLSPATAKHLAVMPKKAAPDLSRYLMSPMPGLLVSLAVKVGQEVKAGEELAVVEAMKMENILRAERNGVIAKLHAKPGDSLAVDQAILEFA